MHVKNGVVLVACATLFLGTGCRKNAVDKSAFKSAINNYYSGRQVCLFPNPVKFPAQADTSNEEQTKGFDALTDAGLLTRKDVEKKRFLIGSKQVNDYDLSEKGRAAWTADQTQPGYGNFCFGHPEVTSIDSYTPGDNTQATQYSVFYHYAPTGVPDWAKSTEINIAFPNFSSNTAGATATANMVKSNNGWQVESVRPTVGGNSPPPQQH